MVTCPSTTCCPCCRRMCALPWGSGPSGDARWCQTRRTWA